MHNICFKKFKVYILYPNGKKYYYKDLNELVAKVHRYVFERQGGRVFTIKGLEYFLDFVLSFYPEHRRYPYYGGSGAKRHRSRWLRKPRTTQERRWRDAWDNEGFDVKYRKRDLPSNWDDIRCSDYGIKNWKHSRRHQWKVIDYNQQDLPAETVTRDPLGELGLQHPSLHCKIYREGS